MQPTAAVVAAMARFGLLRNSDLTFSCMSRRPSPISLGVFSFIIFVAPCSNAVSLLAF